jgi:hypothetical protein
MTVRLWRQRMQLLGGDWLIVIDGITDSRVCLILFGDIMDSMAKRFDQLIEFEQSEWIVL